jgi:hypothetical protein
MSAVVRRRKESNCSLDQWRINGISLITGGGGRGSTKAMTFAAHTILAASGAASSRMTFARNWLGRMSSPAPPARRMAAILATVDADCFPRGRPLFGRGPPRPIPRDFVNSGLPFGLVREQTKRMPKPPTPPPWLVFLEAERARRDEIPRRELEATLDAMMERCRGVPLPDPATMSLAERLAVLPLRPPDEAKAESAALEHDLDEFLAKRR